MNTPRRAAHRLFFTLGHVDLCPDCMSVLAKEGEVAGDPREPVVTFTGHRRTEPAPLGVSCDTCASLEAYEDALNASRVAETPTLAEIEGEDAPFPVGVEPWLGSASDAPPAEDEAGLASY